MSASNRYVNGGGNGHGNPFERPSQKAEPWSDRTIALVAELEVPFDSSVIEWRVTNTSKDKKRGQIIPHADQRAYTDRLNALFSPAGWTRTWLLSHDRRCGLGEDQTPDYRIHPGPRCASGPACGRQSRKDNRAAVFDAAHQPCNGTVHGSQDPARFTSWEIHPVYSVQVCKKNSLDECPADDPLCGKTFKTSEA